MGSTESPGIKGVELSRLVSDAAFGDMRSQGVEFVIARGYQSVGRVDPNLVANVASAWNAGMSHVDVYQFPCFSCGNAAGQANTLIGHLTDNAVKYGMVWLDVEGPGTYWGSSTAANAAFIADWIQAMKSNGANIGFYTSASQWEPIVGSYTGGSPFPLWYAHKDGGQNFDDFSPFGGWTRPNLKTYDEGELSGVGVERIWYPS
ncbi:glycoside hydrolase family 25 protein [Streptomyces sp. NPDC001523]|uniref:glycoside hydrolase family 25 protein n=1 Tax=Streptomyces sp. NPDC001523 TaxID=3154383 RepID=UPI003329CDFE